MIKLNRENLTTLLLIGYLFSVVGYMIVKNISITPDRFFVFLLVGGVLVGRGVGFLKDWTPFFALLLGYEMLRGFADTAGFTVHVGDVVAAEKALFFGYMPPTVLQSWLYHPGQIQWYDVVASVVYFLHFPLPLTVGFFLWLKNRKQYFKFIVALLILSFSGFLTYLVYPAAPPWYAAEKGLIEVNKIMNVIIDQIGWNWNLSYYYSHLNPNPVAAIPSLHAAYPTLVFLALRHYSRKLGYLFLPYPFLVWFSIIYLGEHYVIDALLGVAYAILAYNSAYHLRFTALSRFVTMVSENLGFRNLPRPSLRFFAKAQNEN
jgi:hypothetical protein